MGDTHITGGFHSGFLSGKAIRPYGMIASGAVTSERQENSSIGPTRADSNDLKSLMAPT